MPLKYLGLPIDKSRPLNKQWKHTEDKMENDLDVGKVNAWILVQELSFPMHT
jgi:hypothetical protein